MKIGKVQKLYTIIAPVLVFVTLLFSCPLSVHADTISVLPFYPEVANNVITSSELTQIKSIISYKDPSVDFSKPYYIVRTSEGAWYDDTTYVDNTLTYIVYFPTGDLNGVNSVFFQDSTWGGNTNFESFRLFNSTNTLTVDCSFTRYRLQRREIGDPYQGFTYAKDNVLNGGLSFFGVDDLTPISNVTGDFISSVRYPVYVSGQFQTVDYLSNIHTFLTSGKIVDEDPIPVDPDWPENPDPNVPTPNPPTPPSNPSVEDLLIYIGDLISYYARYWRNAWNNELRVWINNVSTNIKTGFENLYENLVSFFKPYFNIFVGKFNEIINSIKEFATDSLSIFTDIKDLISTISDKITSFSNMVRSLLISVKTFFDTIIDLGTSNGSFSLTTLVVNLFIPSEEDFNTLFENSDTFDLLSIAQTIFEKIFSIWDSIYNLSSSKVLHVPSYTWHGQQIGGYDIDFSWFDSYKIYSDGIISAFLVFSYLWFLFFRLPSFLRGQAQLGVHAVSVTNSGSMKGGNES